MFMFLLCSRNLSVEAHDQDQVPRTYSKMQLCTPRAIPWGRPSVFVVSNESAITGFFVSSMWLFFSQQTPKNKTVVNNSCPKVSGRRWCFSLHSRFVYYNYADCCWISVVVHCPLSRRNSKGRQGEDIACFWCCQPTRTAADSSRFHLSKYPIRTFPSFACLECEPEVMGKPHLNY